MTKFVKNTNTSIHFTYKSNQLKTMPIDQIKYNYVSNGKNLGDDQKIIYDRYLFIIYNANKDTLHEKLG